MSRHARASQASGDLASVSIVLALLAASVGMALYDAYVLLTLAAG